MNYLLEMSDIYSNILLESSPPSFNYDEEDGYVRITMITNGIKVGEVVAQDMSDAYFMFEDYMDEESYNKIFPSDNFLRVEDLTVNKKFQSSGYGRMLMGKVIEYAKNNHFDTIYLNASPMGHDGLPINQLIKFYESLGFSEIPNIQQHPNNREMIMYIK